MMFYTTYFPIKTSNTINGTIGQVVKLSTQPIQGQCWLEGFLNPVWECKYF